ncbi:MAG TPA: S41 family peptidase [Clostridia bacterium]|nr:S41 family peptidase [Clostridia bacterium]
MNKKISIGLSIAFAIMTMAATFAVTMSYSQKIYNKLIPNLSERLDRRYALDEIEELVNAEFYFKPDINNKELNASITDGYLKGLNDPYSKFLTAGAYREYMDKLEGKEHGIGIITALKPDTGSIFVVDVTPGSSAAVEGIEKGDEIIRIEGETVTASNYDKMILKLQGMSLTTVTLTYRRDAAETTVNVMIGFEAQTVAYEVDGEIGYIRITNFYKNTAPQLEKAIAALTKQEVSGIVFDVRNTSEGTIEYAAKAADVIVPIGTEGRKAIATAYDRDDNIYAKISYPSTAGELNLPISVLINAGTSGCGELFAVTMRDYKKSLLVGGTTAGNNTFQSVKSLSDGSAVVLTVATVKPYLSTYDEGLDPDEPVALVGQDDVSLDLLQRADDNQYQKAKSFFTIGASNEDR